MWFFDDAWKAMDGLGQEANKHIGPAAGATLKNLDSSAKRSLGLLLEKPGNISTSSAKRSSDLWQAKLGKNSISSEKRLVGTSDLLQRKRGRNLTELVKKWAKGLDLLFNVPSANQFRLSP
jgi:hypothetical protein